MSNYWGVVGEEARATSNDSVNSTVVEGSMYILGFGLLIEVCAEVVFFGHTYIDVIGRLRCRSIVGLVLSGVCGMALVKFLGFINGLVEGQSLHSPIDCGIGFPEPG